MNQTELHPQLKGLQRNALIIGVVGLVIGIAGIFISPDQFFQSYLFGYIFVLHLPLGCLSILMLHLLVGGQWGFSIRRFLESGAMTLPLMAVLFIPILFGLGNLYIWTDPEAVAESHLLQHKSPYLNVPFFIGRAVLYFVIWVGLAYLLNKWSLKQDESGDPNINDRLKTLSPPGIILFVLASTFAAFDWMMSLEPIWFSSIYGVIFLAGQAVAAFASAIIFTSYMSKRDERLGEQATIYIFNDLGNFLLAFVSFWAYVSFSQYLILWSANLPETVTWYLVRSQNGWQILAITLIFLGFAVPFAVLLSRRNKRNVRLLVALSSLVLVMRFVDLFWIIKPAFSQSLTFHWLDLALPLGLGGIWVAYFIRQVAGKSLLPLHDPRFVEETAEGSGQAHAAHSSP